MIENILWVITARSGSKSVPNKNIKLLNGIPLIAYKIKTALSISPKQNVWVSTDSKEYANIALEYGAIAPFLRPDYLSSDEASSADVILHAMEYAKQKGLKYDFIGLLEPTSPFVYFEDIVKALDRLNDKSKAKAVVAVRETRPSTFFIQEDKEYLDVISKRMENVQQLGRQAFPVEITPSGGFYISHWDYFKEKKTFYTDKTLTYKVPVESELEIDEPIDWEWAEFLLKNNKVNINKLWKKDQDRSYGKRLRK